MFSSLSSLLLLSNDDAGALLLLLYNANTNCMNKAINTSLRD